MRRAASVIDDLGLPVIDQKEAALIVVWFNDVPQKEAVAYDLDRQLIWRYKTNLDGQPLIVLGHPVLEQFEGKVAVKEKK